VKKKQKKVLMIVMGIVAVLLLGVKVGPLFFGKPSPYVDPEKAKRKNAEKATEKGSRKRPAPPRQAARNRPGTRRSARKPPPRRRGERDRESAAAPEAEEGTFAGFELADIPIDLSRVGRRTVRYQDNGRRDPFGPVPFETVVEKPPVLKETFDLQGVLQSTDKRLAIIDNRVYAEGDVLRDGIRVTAIKPTEVVLSDGEMEVTLRLDQPALNMGRP
jgi:hypothetical protein